MTGILGSAILDTAVGLVFVYLLVSLIASVINEWIAQLASLRAKTLEAGLRQMLNDPPTGGLTDQIFSHPLISAMSPVAAKVKLPRPSYLPSRHFALALIDIVAPQGGGTSQSIQDLKTSVGKIENEPVKQALLAIINDAENDIIKAREGIERWFNDVMDRVSGWYKRKLRVITVCVGVVLVILLNADTLSVGQSLWSTPVLRASVATAASDYVKTAAGTSSSFSDQVSQAERTIDGLRSATLPLFWSTQPQDPRAYPWLNASPGGFLSKIVGLVISALAVSLGAPFWFDLLSRFMSMRATGPPPSTRNPVPAK